MEWGAAACPTMGRLPTAGQGHVGTAPLQVVPRGAEGLAPPQGARPWGGHPRVARDVHALGVDTERRPRCRAWSPHSGGDERAAGPDCGAPPSGAMAAAPPCTPTGHRRHTARRYGPTPARGQAQRGRQGHARQRGWLERRMRGLRRCPITIGTCAGGKRSRPWQSWACARRLPPVHGAHRLVALRRTHQGDDPRQYV